MADFYTGTPPTDPAPNPAASPLGAAEFTAGILQATLSTRKVQAICTLAWSGPQIDAYAISLGLGERPEAVEALTGALALAAGADSCRLARAGGKLLLELPKRPENRKELRATRLETLAPPTPTSVALGIATGGAPIWIDLADERHAHVVIGGTTGSGKSVLLRWLLYRLVRQNAVNQLRIILLDPKRNELRDFAACSHLLHPVTYAPLEIARVLGWVSSELERRSATGANRPRIAVVIEEVSHLTDKSREIGNLIGHIAEIGRALGIHIIATTQQPGARSLGDSVINFPVRILGRVASSTFAYGAAGRAKTGADALLGRGDFLFIAAGETVRFQAPLPDGRQWTQIPRTAEVASLERDLPTLVEFGDRSRDPRGGQGGRQLVDSDYRAIERSIRHEGANVAQIQQQFGIGYERAQRIYTTVMEAAR